MSHSVEAGMRVEVIEVAPGVYHARAKHVSWVLVTDGAGVTLVDSGYPGDRARVIASLEEIGRSPADLGAILLTHGHPDHIGSAEYLRRAHHVPVRAHQLPPARPRRADRRRRADDRARPGQATRPPAATGVFQHRYRP